MAVAYSKSSKGAKVDIDRLDIGIDMIVTNMRETESLKEALAFSKLLPCRG